MGLFQKFKDVFKSKKEREEEIKEILEEETVDDSEYFEEEVKEEKNEELTFVSSEEVDDEQISDESEEENQVIVENKQDKKKDKKNKKIKLSEKDKDLVTYDKGLEKTRKEFVSELSLLGRKFTKVTEEYYEELESLLIKADIGVNTVFKFLDRLRDRVKHENITDTSYLTEVIVDELFMIYVEGESLTDKINMAESGPTVILMVGVNGVGKTTTIGKLANKYKNEGKSVMLIAGDTFRAGAVPQLEEWAKRTGSLFYGKENTDPAGVIYDGLVKAKEEKVDIVLIDTAGDYRIKLI